MDIAVTTVAEYRQVELLIDAGKGADALHLVVQLLHNDPANRQLQHYHLLTQIIANGPEPFEAEIDRVRSLTGLPETERAIITQILRRGFESASRKGDQSKAWAYQRSLRRWVAGLPADRPLTAMPVDDAARETAPAANVAAMELATLRSVFAAERDGALVLDRAAVRFEAIRSGWRDKISAGRVAGLFRSLSERMHRPRSSGAGAKVALVAFAFISGAGVSVVAMKFGGWTNERPSIAAGRQLAPVSLEGSAAVLAPDASPSPQNELAMEEKSSKASAPHGRKSLRDSDDVRQAKVLAVPQGGREKKPHDSPYERRLVFEATQTIGLRDEPRYSAPKGRPLESGARLIMVERDGNWIKVRSETTGSTGYVRKEFVAPAAPDS